MMKEKIYQKIFNEISDFLPSDWKKLIIYLEHGEEVYSYSFYVKSNGKYVKCFDLENISEKKLFAAFAKIEKDVSKERSKEQGECWSNMTMVVSENGDMKTYFDYTDLSRGNYQYKKDWKKKYLD